MIRLGTTVTTGRRPKDVTHKGLRNLRAETLYHRVNRKLIVEEEAA